MAGNEFNMPPRSSDAGPESTALICEGCRQASTKKYPVFKLVNGDDVHFYCQVCLGEPLAELVTQNEHTRFRCDDDNVITCL